MVEVLSDLRFAVIDSIDFRDKHENFILCHDGSFAGFAKWPCKQLDTKGFGEQQ